MSAIPKPPRNNMEWARRTEKRLNEHDNATAVRIGEWTLSTQEGTGNLIAGHVDGGSVILAVKPAASEEPDEVTDTDDQPHLKLERQAVQSESRGAAHLVQWDTVAYATGDWGFTPVATDIVIPQDGVYLIIYNLVFLNSSDVVNKAILMIDGVVREATEANYEVNVYNTFYISNTYALTAGQLISAAAYVAGSGTFDFGPSGADPTVFTSLSLTRQAVG
jgi:hypothetical protein